MNFTTCTGYEKEQPVAHMFHNYEGISLVVKCDSGWLCFYGDHDTPNMWDRFDEDEFRIIKTFYPGDKITITF